MPLSCLAPAAATGLLGGWGGLFGSLASNIGGLVLGNLFNLNYQGNGDFDIELAGSY